MKRFITLLSVLSFVFVAHSKIFMKVTTADGKVETFEVESLDKGSYDVDDSVTVSGYCSGHGFVEMGNGVFWATCNVGANSPEQLGDLFYWGDTIPYELSSSFTTHGTPDSPMSLEEDAAYVNMGKEWRVPTIEDYNNLNRTYINKYYTENYNNTGAKGIIILSSVNGNMLFFPISVESSTYEGPQAMYWLSYCYSRSSAAAMSIKEHSAGYSRTGTSTPLPIRAVLNEEYGYVHVKFINKAYGDLLYDLRMSYGDTIGSVDVEVSDVPFGYEFCGWGIDESYNLSEKSQYDTTKLVSLDTIAVTSQLYAYPIYRPATFVITSDGEVDGFEYVDMGLSGKWATYNLGANSSSIMGDYYAWGETVSKDTFTHENYKFDEDGRYYTKYVTSSYSGTVDNKTMLEAEDDAATVNMGENWRLPTWDEWDRLRRYCEWKIIRNFNNSGIPVFMVTDKSIDKSIFIPIKTLAKLDDEQNRTYYWSSEIKQSSDIVRSLTYRDFVEELSYDRYLGGLIRGVIK